MEARLDYKPKFNNKMRTYKGQNWKRNKLTHYHFKDSLLI